MLVVASHYKVSDLVARGLEKMRKVCRMSENFLATH